MYETESTNIEGGQVQSLEANGTGPAKEILTPERISQASYISIMLDTISLCIDLLNKAGNDSGVTLLNGLRERVKEEAV